MHLESIAVKFSDTTLTSYIHYTPQTSHLDYVTNVTPLALHKPLQAWFKPTFSAWEAHTLADLFELARSELSFLTWEACALKRTLKTFRWQDRHYCQFLVSNLRFGEWELPALLLLADLHYIPKTSLPSGSRYQCNPSGSTQTPPSLIQSNIFLTWEAHTLTKTYRELDRLLCKLVLCLMRPTECDLPAQLLLADLDYIKKQTHSHPGHGTNITPIYINPLYFLV